MFGKQFYPTPKALAAKCLRDIEISQSRYVLDPSAGNGAFLEVIAESQSSRRYDSKNYTKNLYAIEIDPELQMILRGKDFNVIHDDFLTYEGTQAFDLIVMNPPFAEGDKHLLKAWEVLHGGDIVCILNAETIRNPFSHDRKKVLELIQQHGRYEFHKDEFTTEETKRKTSVEIAIVWLKKEKAEGWDFSKLGQTKGTAHNIDDQTFQGPAKVDVIENLVDCFNAAVANLKEYVKAKTAYTYFSTKPIEKIVGYDSLNSSRGEIKVSAENPTEMFNILYADLKQRYWSYILTKTKADSYMSAQMRKDYYKFSEQQGQIEFTRDNINKFIDFLFMNRENLMEKALVDVFDWLCAYDPKNIARHKESWKTNSHYKVNKKVIVPLVVEIRYKEKSYLRNYSYGGVSSAERMQDLEKVLCFVTGKKYSEIKNLNDVLDNPEQVFGYGCDIDSEFFTARFYKKGTAHLTFKDLSVHARFNQAAAKGKNWLGS